MKTPTFISIQGSYSQLELALFIGNQKIKQINENSKKASSLLIPHIKTILKNNNLNLSDLDFIGADQGPGAFTSLRVTISTINGLAFANQIPLIGIDGLDALSIETRHNVMSKKNKPKFDVVIPLLNAYNSEVYFCINLKNHNYKNIDALFYELKESFKNNPSLKLSTSQMLRRTCRTTSKKILFSGNGACINKNLIEETFNDNAFIYEQNVCSVDQIAKMALEKWNLIKNKNKFEYKIYPLYLKSQNFAIRPIKK